jgi:hypothetical protein
MKKLIFLGLVTFQIVAFSQTNKEAAFKAAKTITASDMSEHLHIISSDEFLGRETGKVGQKMAKDYLIEYFKELGFSESPNGTYIQEFPLVEQLSNGISLSIGGKSYQMNKDFYVRPDIWPTTTIKNDLVFAGYGLEQDYKNLDVSGKAVVILSENSADIEKEWTTADKIELAKEKGAKVVFIHTDKFEKTLEKYEHYFSKPRTDLADNVKGKDFLPVLNIGNSVLNAICKANEVKLKKYRKKGQLKAQNTTNVELVVNKETNELFGENVLAYLPGTLFPDEVIIITAHYDHIGTEGELIFNGADDDGSGTVALMELAQAFKTAANEGNGPKRSILFMPVSGEEKGLLGSEYYANNPVFPLENTVANLNIDMIGRLDKAHSDNPNYVYLIGSDKLSSGLHEVSESMNNATINLELDYTYNDDNDPNRFYYRSDHYNFAKNDVPVIFYFCGVHEDYHKATDTVEKIDFKKMEKITKLIFFTAWELANRDERIIVDKEPTK